MAGNQKREAWASKIGLVLAMAGNAVGLGNFLRFPMQAAQNGGGAFMIPYIIALIFLGIPLMFVEWGLGRFGGNKGQGTPPGIFALIKNSRLFRLLGVIGICIPFFIASYYCYIESWTLGYSFLALFDKIDVTDSHQFFTNYSGGSLLAYGFFLFTILVNGYVLYRGVSQGIEKAAKILMPLLFLFGVILAIRVATLGTLNPDVPDATVSNGFGYIWNPDLSRIGDFKVWIAAAGQIFFTLSLGMGAIACYASYVKKDDDIVTPGLATAFTNEFCEVVLGGSIAIPLAVAFYGVAQAKQVALTSGFGLGFVSMPLLFAKLPLGNILGCLWFLLLFFAGITSSLAMAQIVVAFLEEMVGFSRQKSVLITMGLIFAMAHLAIFGKGALDEMDSWAGTVGISVFALMELILWVHVFGINKSWKELIRGSRIRLWDAIKWVTAIISPIYLIIILVGWIVQDGWKTLTMEGITNPKEIASRWAVRILMLAVFCIFGYLATRDMSDLKPRQAEDTPAQE